MGCGEAYSYDYEEPKSIDSLVQLEDGTYMNKYNCPAGGLEFDLDDIDRISLIKDAEGTLKVCIAVAFGPESNV